MSHTDSGSESSRKHHHSAAEQGPVRVSVITVSDTRTEETDTSGAYLRTSAEQAGHVVVGYHLVKDEPRQVLAVIDALVAADEPPQVILLTGGTGISKRDTTYDALAARLEKTLPGFGELFRALSFAEIRAAAMLSRAICGTYQGAVLASMPGSKNAVKLAWERLLAPELAHLAWELER